MLSLLSLWAFLFAQLFLFLIITIRIRILRQKFYTVISALTHPDLVLLAVIVNTWPGQLSLISLDMIHDFLIGCVRMTYDKKIGCVRMTYDKKIGCVRNA